MKYGRIDSNIAVLQDGKIEELNLVGGSLEGWELVRNGRMESPFSASVKPEHKQQQI